MPFDPTDENGPRPPDDLPGPEETPRGTGVGELVRRALLAGVGAVFMTEEQIRKTVNELKLPKEALSYLLTQADKTRTEAGRILRREVRRFLNSERFRQQVFDLVSGLTLEVKAEVRLKPQSLKPEIKDVSASVESKPADENS